MTIEGHETKIVGGSLEDMTTMAAALLSMREDGKAVFADGEERLGELVTEKLIASGNITKGETLVCLAEITELGDTHGDVRGDGTEKLLKELFIHRLTIDCQDIDCRGKWRGRADRDRTDGTDGRGKGKGSSRIHRLLLIFADGETDGQTAVLVVDGDSGVGTADITDEILVPVTEQFQSVGENTEVLTATGKGLFNCIDRGRDAQQETDIPGGQLPVPEELLLIQLEFHIVRDYC